jgi:hypothetical protein
VRKLLAAAIVAAVLMAAPAAQASTTIRWVPKAHYPCKYGAEWTLLPVAGITSATLRVDGTPYPMDVREHWDYRAQGKIVSWYAESVGPIDGDSVVTATFEGSPVNPSLDIAACVMVPPSSTPPPTSPPPTSPPPTTTSSTPPPSTTSTPPPSTSTSTSPPPTTTKPPSVAGAEGSNPGTEPCATPPCDTAFTGNATWPFVVIVGLLIVGTTLAWIARKRSQA